MEESCWLCVVLEHRGANPSTLFREFKSPIKDLKYWIRRTVEIIFCSVTCKFKKDVVISGKFPLAFPLCLSLWGRTELKIFIISDPKQTGILSLLWAIPWGSLSEVNIPLNILFEWSFASFSSVYRLGSLESREVESWEGLSGWSRGIKFKTLSLKFTSSQPWPHQRVGGSDFNPGISI